MTDEEIIERCGFGYCETVFTGHYFVDELPDIGNIERLYVRTTDNTLHRFDADLGWVAIGGSGGGGELAKRFDYVSRNLYYRATAPAGSLENAPVWNIKKIEVLDNGTLDNIIIVNNYKWTERGLI